MHLIDAIKLYCHIMQQSGGGIVGRQVSREALARHELNDDIITSIANTISNDGQIIGDDGSRYAITCIAAS